MGLPAYYTEANPSGLVMLPVAWDPLSNPYAVTREQVLLETGRGVTFEYELFTRGTPTYIFTVPASLLTQFRSMHDAVAGNAFYFIPDIGVSPTGALHVRKEPSFLPEPIGIYYHEGIPEQWFRYELKLREEITPADVLD